MRLIITQFFRSLKKGGIAVFQLPTYRLGYRFSLERYLATRSKPETMELHMFPQPAIFEIAQQENARVLEVYEDASVGSFPGISNSFLVQKR
jgi:hypothetical protein